MVGGAHGDAVESNSGIADSQADGVAAQQLMSKLTADAAQFLGG